MNARLDLNFNQAHNATVRFDALRGENKRGFPGGARLPDSFLIEGRDSDSVSIADNYVISSRAVNQARFQHSRLLPRNKGAIFAPGVIIQEPARVVAGSFTGSESAPAFAREERRTQIQDNLLLSAGSHQVKLGCDLQFVRSTFEDLFAIAGQYTFETVDDFLANRPERFIQRFDTESRLANNVTGLFIQDEWKIKPHVTLSYGLRWDDESILEDRDNFSPRISLAWDPFVLVRAERSFALDSACFTTARCSAR